MKEITERVALYREAARHLWNSAFRASQPDWDTRDGFSRVASELFMALVLEPIDYTTQPLPPMSQAAPSHFGRIAVVPSTDEVPIMINREPLEPRNYSADCGEKRTSPRKNGALSPSRWLSTRSPRSGKVKTPSGGP